MKKVISSVLLICLFGSGFMSCKNNNDDPTGDGKPKIENLAVTPSASVKYGDVVALTGKFTDEKGLSSYTVIVTVGSETYESTNMLTGKEQPLNLSLVVPIPKNAQAGNVTFKVNLKNSGNQTVTEEVTLKSVAVPTFEKLYLVIGSRTLEMIKNDDVYVVEDLIAANAVGKIYTKADKTGMFWGWANNAVTGLAEGDIPIGKAEATTLIVSFNTKTFELAIEEGNPWKPINEAIYILGEISGHWMDGNITVEKQKMKMTGFASGDKKYWTWTAPTNCDEPDCVDGMWGNINPGQFRFKIGGKEEYILFDGSKIVKGTSNDESKSFLISTGGGGATFELYFDGTNYNKVSLAIAGKSLDYTNEGFVVNGLPLPASMTFAGGTLAKKEGSFWLYEGVIALTKNQEFQATGVDLSKAKADPDVFLGGGNTWKMIGSSGNWIIRVDPFVYSVYAGKTGGYPDVLYMDGWGWSKNEGDPAISFVKDNRLCLQRVSDLFKYEATFWHHSWGDKDNWGPTMDILATTPLDVDVKIPDVAFDYPGRTDLNRLLMAPTPGGRDNPARMKIHVDLKDGFDMEKLEPVGAKFTITFSEVK